MSDFEGSNEEEWAAIARHIEISIQADEPRLDNVRVEIDAYDPTHQTLEAIVYVSVKDFPSLQEIHFPLTLNHTPAKLAQA